MKSYLLRFFLLAIPSFLFFQSFGQNITTVAGMGAAGHNGDGWPATLAHLYHPHNCVIDASNNLIFADHNNHRIRKISAAGMITSVAGQSYPGFFGDSALGIYSVLSMPKCIAIDQIGNIYFFDSGNVRVRKVDTSGRIYTIFGNGSWGFSGDGGYATAATTGSVEGIAVDRFGNVFISDNWFSRIRKIDTNGIVRTFAGTGSAGFSGDGGPATSSQINGQCGIAFDTSGNLLISDFWNYRIRKINLSGIISTVAGTGTAGYSGDGSLATSANIGDVYGLSVDLNNNIYLTGFNRVRKINGSGIISTVVGTGQKGYNGDGIAATAANINYSFGACADASGNIFVAESDNHRIRKINTSGVITTICGKGNSGFSGDGSSGYGAQLYGPVAVSADLGGNIYVADIRNNRIRRIAASGIITTVAGSGTGTGGYSGDGGQATSASLNSPSSVCVDVNGNIFIADCGNDRIRKVNTSGVISTIAGNGTAGFSGDGGAATNAKLSMPLGVAVDTSGNVYIADANNCRIRKVNTSGIISTLVGSGTCGFSGDGGSAVSADISVLGVSVDIMRNVYIASAGRIRKVNLSGIINTIVGTGGVGFSGDGGLATAAQINVYGPPAIDIYGYIYIADCYNNRIRKVDPAGIIRTLTNPYGYPNYSGDGSLAIYAGLTTPSGIAVNSSREIFFSEIEDSRVRKIDACSTPLVGRVSGSSLVCVGGTISLSYTTSGGRWSTTGTSATIVDTTGVLTGINPGTAIVSYTVSNSCGPTIVFDTITVITMPNSGTISGPTALCVGATITLVDSAGTYGGTWTSSAPGIASINSSTGVVSGMATGTATITYSVSNSCGSNITTRSINVITTLPPGTISGTTTFCQGTSSTLTSSGATGGTWSSSAPGVATVNSSGVVTGLSGGTAVISYTVSNVCGSATATATVTINPLANPGTISGASTVCVGDTINLHNSVTGGTWSSSNATIASVTSAGIVYGVATGTATISYAVTNVCGTRSATQTVTVNTVPAIGTISGPGTVCAYAHITLSGSPSGGSWGSSSTHATINSSGVVMGLSAGAVTISYTFTNGCGSTSATYAITVSGLPHAGPITGSPAICMGSTSLLTGAAAGGTWSSSSPTVATIDTTGSVTALSLGTATITYITGNSCGIDTAYQLVTVIPLPDAGIITGTDSVCPGMSVTLSDAVTGGTWASSNISLASVSSGGVVTGIASGVVTISYSYTNSCGTASVTYPFTVLPYSSCPNGVEAAPAVQDMSMEVFPNPNDGAFSVNIHSPLNDAAHIVVTDLLGRIFLEQYVAVNKPIPLRLNVAKGVYFIAANIGENRFVGKVVVDGGAR